MDRMPDRGRSPRAAQRVTQISPTKKAKEPKGGSKPPGMPVRVKVVWELCSGNGKIVRTFPYADKSAAEAQTKALTWSTGRAHTLRATKVPME